MKSASEFIAANKEVYEDNTAFLRERKGSQQWKSDIIKLDKLSRKHKALRDRNPKKFLELCRTTTPILFRDQKDLFDKFLAGIMTLEMITIVLDTLKKIEDGECSQEEASESIGQVYLDAARRKGLMDDSKKNNSLPAIIEGKVMESYAEFKMIRKQKLQEKINSKSIIV